MILRSTKAGHSLLTSLASCLAPAQPAIPPEGAKMSHLKLLTTTIKKHHCIERGLRNFILKKKTCAVFEGEGFFGGGKQLWVFVLLGERGVLTRQNNK